MEYIVNNQRLKYDISGICKYGEHKSLLTGADDLTAGTHWHEEGFTIAKLFDDNTFDSFKKKIKNIIEESIASAGITIPQDFDLKYYHHYVNSKDLHLKVIEETKLIAIQNFPVPIAIIENRTSEICGINVKAFNPFDSQEVYHLRIIRPQSGDNNPLHRDVWLPDYDDCINLYIPIAGSNDLSSLVLAPGSHIWPESEVERTESGAEINNVKFNVPGVTHIKSDAEFIRGNPNLNEMLVFSPYLIHGGAVNLNKDITRISLEMRLWRAH